MLESSLEEQLMVRALGAIGNALAKLMIAKNIIAMFPKHSDQSHHHYHFCCSPKIKWQQDHRYGRRD